MKNRRLALVAFLLCACMIVGVGYAAVITSLNVDGKVSFDHIAADDVTEYAEQIHFTGITAVKDSNHVVIAEKDQLAIRPVVQSGKQTATLSASFTSENIEAYAVKESGNITKYVADVVYNVEVVCPENDTGMTVTFGDLPQVSGNVGTGEVTTNAKFYVTSHLYENGSNTDVTVVEVESGKTRALELHVRIEVPVEVVTDEVDIPDVDFSVILPVTNIEYTIAD